MSLIGKSGSVALIVWFVSAASGAGGGTEPPVFVLKDGGRISGEFEVKELEVETAYGSLTVPLKEVHKVIFGIISDP
ncbi:MAG: hypothetical protein O7H41_09125, partial [Planctomycetota bacterium]|nr:hypothetical protein [Planctomycetota bacterium]